MALKDIPADQFPLRLERYLELEREIREIANHFAALRYEHLACGFDRVKDELDRAWEAVVAAEQDGR